MTTLTITSEVLPMLPFPAVRLWLDRAGTEADYGHVQQMDSRTATVATCRTLSIVAQR